MSKWKSVEAIGECNFCSLNDHRKVLQFGVLRGKWYGGEALMRICRKCLVALNKLAK